MFGLNEITWKEFISFLTLLIALWYVFLFLWSWFKTREKQTGLYEEVQATRMTGSEQIQPILVSSANFPSQLISPISENSIPLEVRRYEETGPDDGIHIDYLLNEVSGKLEQLLPGIQYQH
ncbi:MAG: hypothetical protein PQJ28_01820 [Spirochaetales bacterium]|nr:hypothetical protein [Spirochaetales bacterium]